MHAPGVSPTGRLLTEQVPGSALAVPLFVQLKLPLYGTPTVPVVGRRARLMLSTGAAATTMGLCAVLFAALVSPVAPVLPAAMEVPELVGVPFTAQVTVWPCAIGPPAGQGAPAGLMEQAPWVTPDGKLPTAQLVPAVALAVPTLTQVNVPA